jgi:hypothetical protein
MICLLLAGERYLSTVLFQSLRDEAQQMTYDGQV